ncbi:MAG: hypothetical protein K8T25_07885 [Planctomycetia bacterium]|nr:hypothetical protein [Planctomycetia bacterium]
MWRTLFAGQNITGETLTKAEALLKRLGSESPLRFRLAKELEDLRKLRAAPKAAAPKVVVK